MANNCCRNCWESSSYIRLSSLLAFSNCDWMTPSCRRSSLESSSNMRLSSLELAMSSIKHSLEESTCFSNTWRSFSNRTFISFDSMLFFSSSSVSDSALCVVLSKDFSSSFTHSTNASFSSAADLLACSNSNSLFCNLASSLAKFVAKCSSLKLVSLSLSAKLLVWSTNTFSFSSAPSYLVSYQAIRSFRSLFSVHNASISLDNCFSVFPNISLFRSALTRASSFSCLISLDMAVSLRTRSAVATRDAQ
mmetsp:Transcript_28027/g.58422  ORF Transcript_28027/g.58422 Transcript_28027/m.58422 type:complete len:249 (+) Transcript_28027:908-1654(+)